MIANGKYYDGITPLSIKVTCILTSEGLKIINSDKETLVAEWKTADIFHDETHNAAFVIGHRLDRSKIELFDLSIARQLGLEEKSKLIITSNHRAVMKWVSLVIAAGILFWFSIPKVSKYAASLIPYEYEVKAATHLKINEYFKSCKMNPEQTKALSSFTNFLYPKNENEKAMPIEVMVSDNPTINAYTLPGGKIILLTGLINEMKSPEELLGIMAHEIGHVVARDSAGFFVRGSLFATFFGFFTGDFSGTFAISPQILLSTAALTFDREMEKAADAFAANRLNKVNVSTSGLRSFFSRMGNDSVNAPDILLTHPDYRARISFIKETYPKENLPKEILAAWPVIKTICN